MLTETKYRPIPSGKYKVRLIDINEDEIGAFNQERITFLFEITEGEYEKSICNCHVNTQNTGKYGLGNKMGKIISALKGTASIGESFNIYDLVGKECLADIALTQGKKIINRINKWETLNG